jgi:hypothetical protein
LQGRQVQIVHDFLHATGAPHRRAGILRLR